MIRSLKKRLSRSSDDLGSSGRNNSSGVEASPPRRSTSTRAAPRRSQSSKKKTSRNTPASNAAVASLRAAASQALQRQSPRVPDAPLTARVTHLANFEACVEAADALCASSGTAFPRIDPVTGLPDCSVLVSPDGDLLLIPGENQSSGDRRNSKANLSSEHNNSSNGHDDSPPLQNDVEEKTKDESSDVAAASFDDTNNHQQTPFSELVAMHDEYESAIFLGNDLSQDKTRNGFSAKGWSIPATSTALQQTQETLSDLEDLCEQFILAKKEKAARDAVTCDQLRRRQPSLGGRAPGSSNSSQLMNDWEIIDPRSCTDFELTTQRVGPLCMPDSSLNNALVALEKYYASMAENESNRLRMASLHRNGVMPPLRNAIQLFSQRANKRQEALEEVSQRARQMEERLSGLKQVAERKWNAVYEAEDLVTQRVQGMMQERSREREKQRLEKLRGEEQRARDEGAGTNLGATPDEIWNIVSAVAESMEDGSFEPMDMPSAPLSIPKDQSVDDAVDEDGNNNTRPDNGAESVDEGTTTVSSKDNSNSKGLPMVSREQIELEVGLPEMRAEAMAADDAVADAADGLMNLLSALDTTRRSARIAAETSLVSACHAQAACIRSVIKLERESLEERLQELKELEEATEKIDVRKDLDAYISLDKRDRGGSSHLGDDDDGGIASALAVLSSHVEGSTGLDPVLRASSANVNAEGTSQDDETTPEMLDEHLEKIFDTSNKHLLPEAADSEETKNARSDFEASIDFLCKNTTETGPSARTKRSAICYALNSKRSSHTEIATPIQFVGLCRLFNAILSGCNAEDGGVANAKMCIMLAQTFYSVQDDAGDSDPDDTTEENEDGQVQKSRDGRIYVKSQLKDHPLWSKDDFWDQALGMQISESLTHSGVMANFDKSRRATSGKERKSEWTQTRKTKWYDLTYTERIEAASQVQAVVFAQLGALAHSMIEFGCGLERSCAFVRRMSIRNQLPSSQRTMLLQHLMDRDDVERRESQVIQAADMKISS